MSVTRIPAALRRLVGLTPEGRTTVRLLQVNTVERVRERQRLVRLGRYPLQTNV